MVKKFLIALVFIFGMGVCAKEKPAPKPTEEIVYEVYSTDGTGEALLAAHYEGKLTVPKSMPSIYVYRTATGQFYFYDHLLAHTKGLINIDGKGIHTIATPPTLSDAWEFFPSADGWIMKVKKQTAPVLTTFPNAPAPQVQTQVPPPVPGKK